VTAFVVSPQAAGLRTLDVAQPGKPVRDRDDALLAVAGSEYLAGFHTLNLSRNVLSPDALDSLGSTGTLQGLRRLILDGCELNADHAAALFGGGLLDRLDGMSLGSDPALDGEAVRVLVSRPGFSRFRMLHLALCPVGDAGCRAVAESRHVAGLEAIALTRAGVSGDGIAALLSSERLPALTTLMLPRTDLDPAAVAAFTASAPVIPLARLDLSYCPIGDAGVGLLAQSPLSAGLTHLRSNECDIGDASGAALAAGNVANLRQLDLGRNRITDEGAAALARSPQLAKLERLNVSRNHLSDTGALALAELPGLKPYGLTLHGNGVSKRVEKKIEAVLEARRESR
jgi:hypothetical protein